MELSPVSCYFLPLRSKYSKPLSFHQFTMIKPSLYFVQYVSAVCYIIAEDPHVNATSSKRTYLPSYSAAVQGSPTMMCHHHSSADCVAGLEVMAPPIPFYLTQHQTYSCLSVVGLPTGSYLHKSDHTLSNTAQFRLTVRNM
jgi:hypothetical protein